MRDRCKIILSDLVKMSLEINFEEDIHTSLGWVTFQKNPLKKLTNMMPVAMKGLRLVRGAYLVRLW